MLVSALASVTAPLHRSRPQPTERIPNKRAPTERVPPGARRLAWLDGLRGLAAMVVVFEHSLDVLFPEVRRTASPWFDFGRYGVFVFFLVSGYIVPASLERRGDLHAFWVGRLLRLYPLFAVAALLGVTLAATGVAWPLPGPLTDRPWTSALAHATMLQDLLGVPNVVNVFWTLSYEMVFYLLVTAMFAAGVHRASAGAAAVFAAAAAVAGAALPMWLIARNWPTASIAATALVFACGLLAVMYGSRRLRLCGALAAAGLALVLLAVNSRIGGMESLAILATMFAGTALYRVEHGQIARRTGLALVALVPALTVAAGAWPALTSGDASWGRPLAVTAAWLTFLLGWALRHQRTPRVLAWLGLVSYSLYLLHPLLLQVVWRLTGEPDDMALAHRLAWGAAAVACLLAAAALTYRHVERPMQNLARRLSRRRAAT
jgi:peptidoglycan/LPS O-acetylase OafA/YrhL